MQNDRMSARYGASQINTRRIDDNGVVNASPTDIWTRFLKYYCPVTSLDLSLDISRMNFDDAYFERMESAIQEAFVAMDALEKGGIANSDEHRKVGHYWLRAPETGPEEFRAEITSTVERVEAFARRIHSEKKFRNLLSIGIGGSALGPMFVADALGDPATDKMRVHFVDNTDPDGIARVLETLDGQLGETLVVVTSKSGGTPETSNGMQIVAHAYRAAGLDFNKHAVAVTKEGSALDGRAIQEKWLDRFPMWDWVGGRTSELSAVGLLPAALQGLDIRGMLAGAAECDRATRVKESLHNPAALLALMWFHATGGKGLKDMVVLPYKDRLLLFSRYLQQLVMESLGKTKLLPDGNVEHQGIAVYGNKGSTDQHAYVQQLRDGINNFFVTFVRVLESGGEAVTLEDGFNAGDYLHGFLLGTRQALWENGRESMTITVRRVDARTVGALIALFERAVGLYATLVGINAYHQPGVEAGKLAASAVLALQRKVTAALTAASQTPVQIAAAAGETSVETVYLVLEHLVANGQAHAAGPDSFTR